MNEPYMLYADDDEEDIFILKDTFLDLNMGISVVGVSNGYQVIDHLQRISPGASYPLLIILDMDMPVLNGKETLELLKTDDIYRLIPVVLFSGQLQSLGEPILNRLNTSLYYKPLHFREWMVFARNLCSMVA